MRTARLVAMLGYVSIAVLILSTICSAQIAYNRVVPYDPRYIVRRIPVRRSAAPEPRIRLPITRYFPQVDTQAGPASYYAQEALAPAAYRVSDGEVYAIPTKWSDEVIPISALERNDDNDYDAYEYDGEMNPTYPRAYANDFAVPQETEPQEMDGDLYNDLMVNYLLGEMQPSMDDPEISEVQRRSGGMQGSQVLPPIDRIAEQNKKLNESKPTALPPTASPSPTASASHSPSVAASQPSTSTPVVPKKDVAGFSKSQNSFNMRLPAAPKQHSVWRDYNYGSAGQKEYPLYRPVQASPMASLESKLNRAKNSPKNKQEALPLIEKMMSAVHHSQDPLKEQLDNLKFRNM